MAWIKSHQGLKRHPKLADLAARLNISRITTIGHLHAFWYDVLEYAPDGDVRHYQAPVLASFAEWGGDPELFVNSLAAAGWLDREGDGFVVHDWEDHAGTYLRSRDRSRARSRAKNKGTAVRTAAGTAVRTAAGTSIERKKERETRKKEKKDTLGGVADAPVCVLTQEGQRLHESYPEARRSTEHATMGAIRKHIKGAGYAVDFAIGRVEVWKQSDQWQRNVIPRLSKFFAEGTWLAEPITPDLSRRHTPSLVDDLENQDYSKDFD